MKVQLRNVLGFDDQEFKVPVLEYESFAEADKAAGREGAGLVEMNNNLYYRGAAPDARELVVDILQELTKIPFKMIDSGEKDDKGQPIMERDPKDSDAAYVKRAHAAAPQVTFEQVQKELTRRASGYTYKGEDGKDVTVPALAVDISRKAREPKGPKVLPAKYKDTAVGILAANNVAKFNKASAKYGIPAFTATGKPEDSVALGWLCKRYADAKAEEARNEFAK